MRERRRRRRRRKKKRGERGEGEGEKKKEVPPGEVIKEGASWLAWQPFKGGVDPVASLHPNGSLLAPPLNTQCLVAKLCLSLTDEWGEGREKRGRGGGTQNAAISPLSFF